MYQALLPKSSISEKVIPALKELRVEAITLERVFENDVNLVPPGYRASAGNLLHYLALRQSDIRDLQQNLALLGLSRLGRSEAHALSSIDAVLDAACALAGAPRANRDRPNSVDIKTGEIYLNEHARRLLGEPPGKHGTRIMVTMPSEAAHDAGLVRELLQAGMNVMRINCAHDDIQSWLAMVGHLREAEQELGRSCKILADLAGPKLRTGSIRAVDRLVEIKIKRDIRGNIPEPTAVWLTPRAQPQLPASAVKATLPVDGGLLAAADEGDRLVVEDTRGVTRVLTLVQHSGGSWLAHCRQHAYIAEGAWCGLYRGSELVAQDSVSPIPEVFQPILLHVGDELLVTRSTELGAAAIYDGEELRQPAAIPCTLDEVFDTAQAGQPIWFDDGRIGGTIRANEGSCLRVEITHAAPQGSKLAAEKGINLPQTDLDIPALTGADIRNLQALAAHIDLVGMSFVRSPQDVMSLHQLLEEQGHRHLGTILKIETTQAFDDLPMILLASLRRPPVGVMVARGDLAVEVGFERLAEVQEEILWMCEAAHIPVIWATQVLESMAKSGMPSRAEVSDAALSIRAECVMLNKGPYIVETVRFLSGVLDRMSGHQVKRRPTLRRLSISQMPNREQ
ncbi:MAG: pyruvate kinase [Nitrosomonadales bacterium]|nr:pyruvate kinase [Nitrosomonadales bacterium]